MKRVITSRPRAWHRRVWFCQRRGVRGSGKSCLAVMDKAHWVPLCRRSTASTPSATRQGEGDEKQAVERSSRRVQNPNPMGLDPSGAAVSDVASCDESRCCAPPRKSPLAVWRGFALFRCSGVSLLPREAMYSSIVALLPALASKSLVVSLGARGRGLAVGGMARRRTGTGHREIDCLEILL